MKICTTNVLSALTTSLHTLAKDLVHAANALLKKLRVCRITIVSALPLQEPPPVELGYLVFIWIDMF